MVSLEVGLEGRGHIDQAAGEDGEWFVLVGDRRALVASDVEGFIKGIAIGGGAREASFGDLTPVDQQPSGAAGTEPLGTRLLEFEPDGVRAGRQRPGRSDVVSSELARL